MSCICMVLSFHVPCVCVCMQDVSRSRYESAHAAVRLLQQCWSSPDQLVRHTAVLCLVECLADSWALADWLATNIPNEVRMQLLGTLSLHGVTTLHGQTEAASEPKTDTALCARHLPCCVGASL